ncbi:MAG: hypothetical protein RRY38_04850, partial [Oscillospiraceae bacterium]
MREHNPSGFRLNGLSIVLMLVLLCLTVFGVLSLVTAKAAENLSRKNAVHIENYAACDASAQKTLYLIREALGSATPDSELGNLGASVSINNLGDRTIIFESERYGSMSISVALIARSDGTFDVQSY